MGTVLTINSNLASLRAQRELSKSTDALQQSFERLSSGLRINRASDDAAGLAIGTGLKTDSRVYSQAVRNVNDAISLTQIASGAMDSLTQIVTRLEELAEQSANGTLSSVQRKALDQEGQALTGEYSRIISTTNFNGLNLLDGSTSSIDVQAGYTPLTAPLASLLTSASGDGSFKAPLVNTGGGSSNGITFADVNGDGNLDMLSSDSNGAGLAIDVFLGNGDGTFQAEQAFADGGAPGHTVALDFNGDGKLDIAAANGGGTITVLTGNGNGSFKAPVSYDAGTAAFDLASADFNGDGRADLVTNDGGLLSLNVLLGNGDGTFKAKQGLQVGSNPSSVKVGDFNGDGKEDIISSDTSSAQISVIFGNGDGTFLAGVTYSVGNLFNLNAGDFNGDGVTDFSAVNNVTGALEILFGNSNGSYSAPSIVAGSSSQQDDVSADVNGDGKLDLISSSAGPASASVWIGNGNGTFKAPSSYPAIFGTQQIAVADLNKDGSPDIVAGDNSPAFLEVYLGNTIPAAGLKSFSLLTQAGSLSALTDFKSALTVITSAVGQIGSTQSRLSIEVSNLKEAGTNFDEAESRIMDVDVAQESAELTRNNILQQAAAAVLAQANQQPTLALTLLKNI